MLGLGLELGSQGGEDAGCYSLLEELEVLGGNGKGLLLVWF